MKALSEHNIERHQLNVFATIDDINTIKACIINGDKYAFTSKIAIQEDVDQKKLKIIPIDNLEIPKTMAAEVLKAAELILRPHPIALVVIIAALTLWINPMINLRRVVFPFPDSAAKTTFSPVFICRL